MNKQKTSFDENKIISRRAWYQIGYNDAYKDKISADGQKLINILKHRISLHEKDAEIFKNEKIKCSGQEMFLRLADEDEEIIKIIEKFFENYGINYDERKVSFDYDNFVKKLNDIADIKFNSFSKPLITVEDVIKIAEEFKYK